MTNWVPRRFKRMLFVGSVIGFFCDDPFHSDIPEYVNEKLSVSTHSKTLLFPMIFLKRLWHKHVKTVLRFRVGEVSFYRINVKTLSDRDLWKLSAFMSRNGPAWLSYGSLELMTVDVHDGLECLAV